jgi:hypothetical protein
MYQLRNSLTITIPNKLTSTLQFSHLHYNHYRSLCWRLLHKWQMALPRHREVVVGVMVCRCNPKATLTKDLRYARFVLKDIEESTDGQ